LFISFSTNCVVIISQNHRSFKRSHKVTGSRPKDAEKSVMVKEGCFLPAKKQKALEDQGNQRNSS
jgi:hypothetical protein